MNGTEPRLGFIGTEGAGPPIILLHGFAGSAQSWNDVRRGLGADRAVLAFDLPGHGGSLSFPGFGAVPFAAKSVVRELDQRGISEFHLAGHSMGGAVAALIAIGQPEGVLSATLLSPGGMSAEINAALLRSFAKAGSEAELKLCLSQMFAPGAAVSATLIRSMAAQRAIAGQQEALAQIVELILRGDGQGVIARASLEALTMPVTVVWGAKDGVMPCDALGSIPKHFKSTLLPNAGHMLPDEVPSQVANAISGTIARAEAQTLPPR
jgi:pimeloyl-ACP methyl ester carboxylesterase